MQAGFEFAVSDGPNGAEAKALPILITSGCATFKAALRVRVQAGTTVTLFGTGFDFEPGTFADLIEYQATISTTPACELSTTESLDVNIGAFAHAVVEINFSKFGMSPAVITTILELPLPSLCLSRQTATSGTALSTDSALNAVTTSLVLPMPPTTVSLPTGPLATHVIPTLMNNSTGRFFLQASEALVALTIKTVSPLSLRLTPCATPHVETVYTPTFTNPVYTMPTATVSAVPYPQWNVTSTSFLHSSPVTSSRIARISVSTSSVEPFAVLLNKPPGVEAAYDSPTAIPTSVAQGLEEVGAEKNSSNGTLRASATESLNTCKGMLAPFTGAASGPVGSGSAFTLAIALGVGILVLW
ncbi:hypothetical protein ONS96_001312 [Cadophora gregata f. sp. sojae]|nr:hypothetical protein ONS96_001312 [Cadophora gregata f. sp. sojae]